MTLVGITRNYKWKSDVTWTSDDIISYRSNEGYEFDQAASGNLTEEDELMTLNPVLNVTFKLFIFIFLLYCKYVYIPHNCVKNVLYTYSSGNSFVRGNI